MAVVCTDDKQCSNGGICVNSNCLCPEGTFGARCDTQDADGTAGISSCTKDGNECQNGGSCVLETEEIGGNTVDANYCKCPEGTFGAKCHGKHVGGDNDVPVNSGSNSNSNNGNKNTTSTTSNTNDSKDSTTTSKDSTSNTANDSKDSSSNTNDSKDSSSNTTNESKDKVTSTNTTDTTSEDKTTTSKNTTDTTSKDEGNTADTTSKDKDNTADTTSKDKDNTADTTSKDKDNTGDTTSKENIKNSNENDVCMVDDKQCQNGGVCVIAAAGNYCSCPEGTSGTYCHGKGVCPLKCQHGSSCRHFDETKETISISGILPTDFYCECVGSYKGLTCEIPFQVCFPVLNSKSHECLYGGKCVPPFSTDSGYSCSCPKGRQGKSCEFGQQSNIEDYNGTCNQDDDCQHGGRCIHEHDAETTAKTGMVTKKTHCLCTTAWGGENCELQCESINCQHGGSCRYSYPDDDETVAGFSCECNDNFTGKECEIPVQKCSGSNGMECLNGGKCIGSEVSTIFWCSCPPGLKGERCEITDFAYDAASPSTPNSSSNKELSPSSSSAQTSIMPVSIVAALLVLIALLTFGFFRKKRRQKGSGPEEADAVAFDDGNQTTEVSNNLSTAIGDEDIFDYDIKGVVDVSLSDAEPVELSKEKQIV